MKHPLHPLCTLFPRMDGAEFDALREDIRANGLRQPIVLYNEMILDGGNRYRACLEAGVAPTFIDVDEIEGRDNIVSFVLSANLHRRHMTPGQQAAIVASAQDWAAAFGHGGDRVSPQSAILHLDSVADRAAQSGASVRTQKMADKVAKEDPELAIQVAHGEVSLPAAVEKITGKRPGKKKPAKKPAEDVSTATPLEKPSEEPGPVEKVSAAAFRKLQQRNAELEAENAALRQELAETRANAEVMADELSGLQQAADPEHAKKFIEQTAYLRVIESQRDSWMNKSSAMVREIKRLQKVVAKLERDRA